MPVVKHGIAFKYFDKAICGVVALALLAGLGFALTRGSSARDAVNPGQVTPILANVQAELAKLHEKAAPKDYIGEFRNNLKDVRTPRTVPSVFYMPLPVVYPPLAISPNREFVLEFSVPITEGSIKIDGDAGLVQLVQHPVGGDYKRALLRSGSLEGTVTVEGLSSDGVRHTYPVRVDPTAGKTAYPPEKLAVVSAQKGSVVLNIIRNPQNAAEGVTVAEYEVWRRDWQDPLGAYRKVANVAAEDIPLTETSAYTAPPTSPYAATQTEVPEGIYWEDTGVTPGQRYGYKVRMVGSNTYPAASDFTQPELAEVEPEIDFRTVGSAGSKVRCEVIKAAGSATPVTQSFSVVAGDQIGGVVKDPITGADSSYLTGNLVLEFQPSILVGRASTSDRLIYADPDGFLRQRLRRESKVGKDQWEAAATGAARRPMGPGAGLPGAYGAPGIRR